MKNKVSLSQSARLDLLEIKEYISKELENPIAAKSTLRKIMDQVRTLRSQPLAGTPVPSADMDGEFRYLTSGNYMIFYHVRSTEVYIDRVLYGRRDYLRVLFEDAWEDQDVKE